MEYLVTMTTSVPDGTSEQAIADVRAREAAHTRELAAQGHILRLWRPPRAPAEWRTLGLFSAADRENLEQVLASMPLRVWRSDEVTELARHPNDPGGSPELPQQPAAAGTGMEFFTSFVAAIPGGRSAQAFDEAGAGEAKRSRELAEQGYLIRLWLLSAWPDGSHALGLWQALDAAQVRAILDSLPLGSWLTEQITPLTPHPSDPAVPVSR